MRGHYEGASTKFAHDESACGIAGGGVKPCEGLVEKDGIARGGKGSDELHAPALPARELAALPVEEQAMIFAPASRALATAMALARSFRDAVGFWPSSFTYNRFSPSLSARRGSSYRGELH